MAQQKICLKRIALAVGVGWMIGIVAASCAPALPAAQATDTETTATTAVQVSDAAPTLQVTATAPAIQIRLAARFAPAAGSSAHGPLHFGDAIDLEEDTLVVGAPESTALAGYQKGKVFVYGRQGDNWVEVARLTASDAEDGSQGEMHFGRGLALQGDTLAVGAPAANAGVENAGAVYVFERQGGEAGWVETGVLSATGGLAGEGFGGMLDMEGGVLLAGGGYSGRRAHVFERRDGAWVETATLTREDLGEKDTFGQCLAASQSWLAVCSMDYDPALKRYGSGSVSIYQRQGDRWVKEAEIKSSEAGLGELPASLDFQGNILAIGWWQLVADSITGAVTLFEREDGIWRQQVRLAPPDGPQGGGFGSAVALDEEGRYGAPRLAVGAAFDLSEGMLSGSAYLFEQQGADWVMASKLWPEEQDRDGNLYGSSLRWWGDTLAVALPDEFGQAVYVYETEGGRR